MTIAHFSQYHSMSIRSKTNLFNQARSNKATICRHKKNATGKLNNLQASRTQELHMLETFIMSFLLILKTLTREDASIWTLVSKYLCNIYCFPHFKVASPWRYTSAGNCQNTVSSPAKLVSYSVVIYSLQFKTVRSNSKCNKTTSISLNEKKNCIKR